MDAIYRQNLAVLKQNHPHVYKAVTAVEKSDYQGEVFVSPQGSPNLRVNLDGGERAVHTAGDFTCDPSQLAGLKENKYYAVVIMGMGLGYTVETILAHKEKVQKLVVFESEPWIFKLALEHRDLTGVLSDPRLLLCIGEDGDIPGVLGQAQRVLQVEDIHLMKQKNLNEIWPEKYDRIYKEAFAIISQYNIEGGTISKHGRDIVSNRLAMLTSVHHNRLLENIGGRFSDVPAFIVAAGPSLDQNMEVLKKAKGRGVVIAVDTVVPNLIQNGIKPDFVCCLDYLEFTYEKISGQAEAFSGISIICMGSATWKVPKMIPADNVFWCFPASPMEKWLCEVTGGSLLAPGAGTVAHLNLIAATILGCSEIIFVGQDLAYSRDHFYTSNVVLSEHDDIRKRIDSNADDIMWVTNNEGNKVPTSRQFYAHINTFENMINGFVTCPCINTSQKGAMIKGTAVMTLDDAIERYCRSTIKVDERLKQYAREIQGPDPARLKSYLTKMLDKIAATGKKVKKAEKLGRGVQNKLQKKSGKAVRSWEHLPRGVQQDLTKIDRAHQALDSKSDFWPLLDEVTQDFLKKSDRMKLEIDLISGKPGKFMTWLEKSLERLSYVNRKRMEAMEFFAGPMKKAVDRYERERQLENRLAAKGEDDPEMLMAFVSLYFETNDLVLAEPYMDRLSAMGHESAQLSFFHGVLQANRLNFKAAEKNFQKAMTIDPEISGRIKEFKFNQGNKYLVYASWYKNKGRSTFINMLIKGIWNMPENAGIKFEIQTLIDEDLKQFKAELGTGLEKKSPNYKWLNTWKEYLEMGIGFERIPERLQVSEIYRFLGMYEIVERNYGTAAALLETAHTHRPEDPEVLIQIADAYFAQKDSDKGMANLHKAVALDRSYGRYWENLGDNLKASNDIANAAVAYANCFNALPEHRQAGVKLAECLGSLGQEDQARQILEQIQTGSN